jgi:hypothetical protein
MGGKGGNTGQVSPQVQSELASNESALVGIAQSQEQNAQQLYGLTEPGLVQSEDFYQSLASGNPAAIMRAIAPTAQAASQGAAGAKANIMANDPAGGEKNLALEQTDLTRGAQISSAASGATLGAPNALGQLAGQGIGESQGASGQATAGLNSATQSAATLQGLTFQGQQLQMEQKGQTLGAVGGLAGDATQLGTGKMGSEAMMAAFA